MRRKFDVRLGARPRRVTAAHDGFRLEFEETDHPVMFERVLIATGRHPRTEDLGLESVGVATDQRGAVQVNARLRTTAKSIYAVGDVTGAQPFTHVAAHHARVATPNALFHARSRVAKVVPRTT
ncbi:MAG: FAD-dependent oxidoreductase, partial [Trebonia sp.]